MARSALIPRGALSPWIHQFDPAENQEVPLVTLLTFGLHEQRDITHAGEKQALLFSGTAIWLEVPAVGELDVGVQGAAHLGEAYEATQTISDGGHRKKQGIHFWLVFWLVEVQGEPFPTKRKNGRSPGNRVIRGIHAPFLGPSLARAASTSRSIWLRPLGKNILNISSSDRFPLKPTGENRNSLKQVEVQ